MNKQVALIAAALVLALLYIAYFTDWVKPGHIQISWRKSPTTGAIVFYLDKPYKLSSVEVVDEEDAKTNKYPHPLWHMVSGPKATPTDSFAYGYPIQGMKPEVATAVPEPLQPEVNYLLVVKSGGIHQQQEFALH